MQPSLTSFNPSTDGTGTDLTVRKSVLQIDAKASADVVASELEQWNTLLGYLPKQLSLDFGE